MARDTTAADDQMAVVQVPASFLAPDASFAFSKPAACRHLLLSEKLHTFFALHVQITEERIAPTSKWEPSHRGGHPNVDSDHSGLYPVLEFACRFSGACKDGSAIAV